MKKVPIEVNDFPGFVSNRILLPMINEAIYCVYEGVATTEVIEELMKLGMNHSKGPLTLTVYRTGCSKYHPCPLLRKYVKADWEEITDVDSTPLDK